MEMICYTVIVEGRKAPTERKEKTMFENKEVIIYGVELENGERNVYIHESDRITFMNWLCFENYPLYLTAREFELTIS